VEHGDGLLELLGYRWRTTDPEVDGPQGGEVARRVNVILGADGSRAEGDQPEENREYGGIRAATMWRFEM
jgi:hypothetical protein